MLAHTARIATPRPRQLLASTTKNNGADSYRDRSLGPSPPFWPRSRAVPGPWSWGAWSGWEIKKGSEMAKKGKAIENGAIPIVPPPPPQSKRAR